MIAQGLAIFHHHVSALYCRYMHWFGELITGLVAAYLAVTVMIVGQVWLWLEAETPPQPPAMTIATTATTTQNQPKEPLAELPSQYERGGALPDILIDNASYQQAAVADAVPDRDDTDVARGVEVSEPGVDTATTVALNPNAMVNLRCTYTTDSYIRSTTGTGFMVSDNGVILTNAHVAFFLLLRDIEGEGTTECVVNTGRESTPEYAVDLLYISPAWIQENAGLISEQAPKGTGERDYALLYVTERLDGAPLPAQFAYISPDPELLSTGTIDNEVTIGGYPAERIIRAGEDFVPVREVATTTVAELFTFGSGYADVLQVAPTTLGQHGISGGPVVNADDQAIGLISTKSGPNEDGLYGLNAITISYIDRTIQEETGFTLQESLGGNLPYRATVFRDTLLPFLTQMVANEL